MAKLETLYPFWVVKSNLHIIMFSRALIMVVQMRVSCDSKKSKGQ